MTVRFNRREFLISSSVAAAVGTSAPSASQAKRTPVRVAALKVDYLDRPLGLENSRPRFSWQLDSSERNVRQRAYRILVASSEGALRAGRGDLWDSGKVNSRKSLGVPYQGQPLTSRERCWWKVLVWVERNSESVSSEISWWEMGLLAPKDWSAQWLAVEDAVARADREAGLHWMWGTPTRDKSTRGFRYRFHLPTASPAGAFYAVTNDWSWWAQISRIWIDGTLLAGTGSWIDSMMIAPTAAPESVSGWLALPPLSAGDHLIAVEVNTAAIPANMIEQGGHAHGLAAMARLQLSDGKTLRMVSGAGWKTQLVEDTGWYTPGYDDTGWDSVVPALIGNYQPWPAQPAMNLRRAFSLEKPLSRARLYATALGAYEARLNGRRVGDAQLSPEISQYDKRVLYQVYDVTSMLQSGANVLGLTVGDGWYASFDGRFAWGPPPRRVLGQLELTFADGTREVVATGPGWRMAPSPIQRSEIRVGEVYDARLEQVGWDTAGFKDSLWAQPQAAEAPPARLLAQTSPPIRATQILKPRSISQPRPAVYVVDFGQNFAGWCRLRVKGSAGTRIELKFAELLTPSGEASQPYPQMGEPKLDVFVLKGDAAGETFEPHFTYRGFRYVEVRGLPSPLTADAIEGVAIHSDIAMTGRLRIDAPELEQFWRNTVWTQRSNFVSIQTDCPSREQRGWLDSALPFLDAAAFNMDVMTFWSHRMQEVFDRQAPDGALPMQAAQPHHHSAFYHNAANPITSGDAGIIVPWMLWRRYGDLALVEQNWPAMNRYANFILENNPDYVWRNKRAWMGDWLDLNQIDPGGAYPPTPKDLIGTAFWAHMTNVLMQMAQALRRPEDSTRLSTLFERIRTAFNETYVKSDGTVGQGSQTSYILALKFGLLPEPQRPLALERLAAEIRQRGVALTTGIVGTQFVLDVLVDGGMTELAYDLLLRRDYPSWRYMVRQGATTVWETWSGDTPGALSQNHVEFGSVCGFLFRRLAGIDEASPGFERMVIRPVLDARVKRGGGDYDSVMGRISTDWSQNADGGFSLEVRIPANTTARVHLPARLNAPIREGRREILGRKDLRLMERSHKEAVLEIGSGTYHFEVKGAE